MNDPTIAHRISALAVTVTASGFILISLLYPYHYFATSFKDRIDDIQFRINRLTNSPRPSADVPGLAPLAAEQIAGLFLAANNRELAFADLQAKVREIVRASRAEIRSTTTLHTKPEGRFSEIRIGAHLTIGVEGLRDILNSLESDDSRLYIDNVSIVQRFGPRSQNTTDENRLEVRFEVFGYFDAGAETDGPA